MGAFAQELAGQGHEAGGNGELQGGFAHGRGDGADQLAGGDVFAVADQKGFAGGGGVLQAVADGVGEVADVDQAAAVIDQGEGQGDAALDQLQQGQEVGADAGAVDQGWAQDDHFQAGFGGDLVQALLCFPLGDAVGVSGGGGRVGGEMALLAIDFDAADEDQTPHAGLGSLARQIQGAGGVDGAKGSQGVLGGVVHDMDPGCQMHHRLATRQGALPLGIRPQVPHHDAFTRAPQSGAHLPSGLAQERAEVAADKAGGAGDKDGGHGDWRWVGWGIIPWGMMKHSFQARRQKLHQHPDPMGHLPVAGEQGVDAQFRLGVVGEDFLQAAVGQAVFDDEAGLAGDAQALGGGAGEEVAVVGVEAGADGEGAELALQQEIPGLLGAAGIGQTLVVDEFGRVLGAAVAGQVVGGGHHLELAATQASGHVAGGQLAGDADGEVNAFLDEVGLAFRVVHVQAHSGVLTGEVQ